MSCIVAYVAVTAVMWVDCRGNDFTEPFPNNGYTLWFCNSGFRKICHYISKILLNVIVLHHAQFSKETVLESKFFSTPSQINYSSIITAYISQTWKYEYYVPLNKLPLDHTKQSTLSRDNVTTAGNHSLQYKESETIRSEHKSSFPWKPQSTSCRYIEWKGKYRESLHKRQCPPVISLGYSLFWLKFTSFLQSLSAKTGTVPYRCILPYSFRFIIY
jgi:hypothetical protein